jgi:polysaccharide export outer membrane protein
MRVALQSLLVSVFAIFWAITASAQAGNYGINVGDTLNIEVLEDATLNRAVLVTPDGRISFPLAGTVRAAGQTVEQVQRALISKLTSNFASPPTIYVAVAQIPPRERLELEEEEPEIITVYLLGEVNAPGPKGAEPGTSFLQLLAQSGGFTRFAATKRVQLRRREAGGKERLIKINYRALSRGANLSRDVILRDGDVILVPERKLFE